MHSCESDKNDKCCAGCKIKPSGNVCRTSRGVCDLEEQCNGVDGACPDDAYKEDLTTCEIESGESGQCATGDCTSRDYQCKLRGTVAGITRECPGFSDQCTMYCQADASSSTCIQISGFYADGTACAFQGKCKKGNCEANFSTSLPFVFVMCSWEGVWMDASAFSALNHTRHCAVCHFVFHGVAVHPTMLYAFGT
jgi:hypothetical protein